MVLLSETVGGLAAQAAKYWGLDPGKVFFLDRDGCIVPDKMQLKDIILPPEPPQGTLEVEDDPASSSHDAVKKNELWTVKGLDYRLTLVRAGTALQSTDDNNEGEKWADFTFDHDVVDQDLEMTLKKRGENTTTTQKVDVDSIPKLAELIEEGVKKAKETRQDLRFRLIEASVFVVSIVFFHLMLMPDDDWNFSMISVQEHILTDLSNFSINESDTLGVSSFSELYTQSQFEGWLSGPLTRTILEQGLKDHQLYILSAVGWQYTSSTPDVDDIEWCSDSSPANCTATANTTCCTPTTYQNCANKRAVMLYQAGWDDGNSMPTCSPLYSEPILKSYLHAFMPKYAFSYIVGQLRTYCGGDRYTLDITSAANLASSLDALDEGNATAATMISLHIFSPALGGIIVVQALTEFTQAGLLITTINHNSINLNAGSTFETVSYVITIFLAIVVFGMEMANILSKSKEAYRDKCSLWTWMHVLLPVLTTCTFLLRQVMIAFDSGSNLEFTSKMMLTEDSLYQVFVIELCEYAWKFVNLFALMLCNVLLARYCLLYFKQMHHTSDMIRKLKGPLSIALVFLLIFHMMFAIMFYGMYSEVSFDFKDALFTFLTTVELALGTTREWYHFDNEYKYIWRFLMVAFFLAVTLIIRNIPLAIMASHKQEMNLNRNHSHHVFWMEKKSRLSNQQEFSLSTVGHDFKDPKHPKENEVFLGPPWYANVAADPKAGNLA
eukprot:NODE_120_length_3601_cov_10.061888.p1 GENE.NODE_120_length_3601_cov_10.061888~~NODE_120_length_3601_cov_10.061888.p1  ORF type:complete len:805 (-),score=220.07 NODE_120_length_3601_cov_10.061888:1186-3354(-)